VSRYIVTELTGYLGPSSSRRVAAARPGLSVHVLDTLHNHRLMATWRSEDNAIVGRTRAAVDAGIRLAAEMHAAKLEAEHDAAL